MPRFAKIIYINQQLEELHVQWFEHSSKTILQELANPQELFLCHLCGDIKLRDINIAGKVIVHQTPRKSIALMPEEFFC